MTTITDIIDGSVTEREGKLEHARVFIVSGLKGQRHGRLYSAFSASGIPRDRDRHPTIPRIRVIARSVAPDIRDPNIARVTITYGIPELFDSGSDEAGGGQWSFSAELVTETTNVDIRGKPMKTEYATQGAGSVTLTILRHEVEVDRALFTARCRRTEKQLDRNKIQTFSGSINRHRWSGEDARKWLCRINAEPNNKGSYNYEYIFHLSPDAWRADLASRVDGVIPLNAVLGNGRAFADVYPRINFDVLGLKMP